MSTSQSTILALGATGGSILTVLVQALEAGHDCIALVRNESKLSSLLSSAGVSNHIIQRHLTVLVGDVKDQTLMSKALFHKSLRRGVVDIIISGVGVYPDFTNPLRPTFPDHTICQDAANTVLGALKKGLKPGMKKPLFIALSTFGISDHGRDVPLMMYLTSPLYNWVLKVPHVDKKKMEKILEGEVQKVDSAISAFTVIRASWLTDGDLLGVDCVRSDTEKDGKVAEKSMGYTISRKDVGNWIYQSIVTSDKGMRAYTNKFVGVSY